MTESVAASVPVALSTAQTEETFSLARYEATVQGRSLYLGPRANADLRKCIIEYYGIGEIVDYLRKNQQFQNITLQFPDFLVQDSSLVTQCLQDTLLIPKEDVSEQERKFWILADTAYSACCVDEVASEHVKADIIIHFGDACLNPIKSLPVVYSFGRPYLDLDKIVHRFREIYNDKSSPVCLMADAPHSANMRLLGEALKEDGYKNLVYALIDSDFSNEKCVILQQDPVPITDRKLYTLGNRAIYATGKHQSILDESALQEEYDLFHVTLPQDPHLLFLTTKFKSVALYDTKSDTVRQGPFPSLMKRYKFMHVARTAGCIGILVNTLSLKNTKQTINRLMSHIRNSGKKHYLFVVGKPNVAKLANFEPVDIWCILGCGQGGIILDQNNEFYKPIITPYELTMALKPEVTWTGRWVVDFKNVLDEIENENTVSAAADGGDGESLEDEPSDEAPEFDAVTGKYISTSRPLRRLQHLEIESPQSHTREVIKNVTGGVIIKGTVSTSAAQLQNRGWTGLGSDYSSQQGYDESGATVEEGISGIASGYGFDRENRRKPT